METVLTCLCGGQSWQVLGSVARCCGCQSIVNLASLTGLAHGGVDEMNLMLRQGYRSWLWVEQTADCKKG